MERDSFIFYRSFYEGIKEYSLEDQAQIYNAIFKYQFEGVETKLTGIAKAAFIFIKPQLDANNFRYENGCKGGAPKGNQNAKKNNQNNLKQPMVDFESIRKTSTKKVCLSTNTKQLNNQKQPNENENENENEEGDGFFSSSSSEPSFEEIFKYGASIGADKEYCRNFFDYYEKQNWVNSDGDKINNWQRVFDNWWNLDRKKFKKIEKKDKAPAWVGKDFKKSKPSESEEAEVKEMLKEFK